MVAAQGWGRDGISCVYSSLEKKSAATKLLKISSVARFAFGTGVKGL